MPSLFRRILLGNNELFKSVGSRNTYSKKILCVLLILIAIHLMKTRAAYSYFVTWNCLKWPGNVNVSRMPSKFANIPLFHSFSPRIQSMQHPFFTQKKQTNVRTDFSRIGLNPKALIILLVAANNSNKPYNLVCSSGDVTVPSGRNFNVLQNYFDSASCLVYTSLVANA